MKSIEIKKENEKEIQVKVCIHCGEEFKETYNSYAVDCVRCITKDFQE